METTPSEQGLGSTFFDYKFLLIWCSIADNGKSPNPLFWKPLKQKLENIIFMSERLIFKFASTSRPETLS